MLSGVFFALQALPHKGDLMKPLLILAVAFTAAVPAAAQFIAYVSDLSGSDTMTCGYVQTPCKSLQHVHDFFGSGTTARIVDAGNYIQVAISKPFIIDGGGNILVAASTAGVTV